MTPETDVKPMTDEPGLKAVIDSIDDIDMEMDSAVMGMVRHQRMMELQAVLAFGIAIGLLMALIIIVKQGRV